MADGRVYSLAIIAVVAVCTIFDGRSSGGRPASMEEKYSAQYQSWNDMLYGSGPAGVCNRLECHETGEAVVMCV